MRIKPIQLSTTHAFNFKPSRHAGGFIQGVLLFGIALLAVVIAAFSSSNKSTSLNAAVEENKVVASTVVSQANQLRMAADRFYANYGSLDSMTFDTTPTTGLFNPTDKYGVKIDAMPRAYIPNAVPNWAKSTAAGAWVHVRGLSINGGGVHVITTGPLKKTVCTAINASLFGVNNTKTTNIPTGPTDLQFREGGQVTGVTITTTDNAEEACVTSGTDIYYFYKVIGVAG